ncbi:MAG: YezD family protein [Verrucomicrobiota bacterium]
MSEVTPIHPSESAWLPIVQKQVASIHFGVVLITVHNGEVVQIECTEKTRIDRGRIATDLPGR